MTTQASVPFLDLHSAYIELKAEIDSAISDVLNSGNYILGEQVSAFESEWAHYCEASCAVGLANGLEALTISLQALNIGPGDEVLVPANTYIATWLAVSSVGAVPIPVEPDPNTYNINPSLIHDLITPRTAAIIPVHLYGYPADLNSIISIAREHSLFVIEDAAQSHGAKYHGSRIGAHGDIVCWSFYPGKNLGAFGDAGAITTNNPYLADKVQLLRNYGSRKKYYNEVIGRNSRLDPIQAAVLRIKLKYLDIWNVRRNKISLAYRDILENSLLLAPKPLPGFNHSWHQFVVASNYRDEFQKFLTNAGIGSLIHYPVPPHLQSCYQHEYRKFHLPITERLAKEVISLPIYPHLSAEHLQYIKMIIIQFLDSFVHE